MNTHVIVRRKGFILNPMSSPFWTWPLAFGVFSDAHYNWKHVPPVFF